MAHAKNNQVKNSKKPGAKARALTAGVQNLVRSTQGAIENDREFKAHIYQQLAELQPFLSEEAQISVAIQVEKDANLPDSKTECALRLVATLGDFRLEAEGRDADHYTALDIAKRKMFGQLTAVHGASIDSRERNAQIQALARGELTIH